MSVSTNAASLDPVTMKGKHRGMVTRLAFSPCGQVLASGGNDATVRVWNPHTGELLGTLPLKKRVHLPAKSRWANPWGVNGLAVSPQLHTIAIAVRSLDSELSAGFVWDRTVNKLRWVDKLNNFGDFDRFNGLSFSPDGRRLAVASEQLRVYDPADPKDPLTQVAGPGHRMTAISYHHDGMRLVTANEETWGQPGRLAIWLGDARDPERVETVDGTVRDVRISLDGRLLATANDAGAVTVREWPTLRQVMHFDPPSPATAVGFIAGGIRLVVALPEEHELRLWDDAVREWTGMWEKEYFHTAVVSPDGRSVAFGSGEGRVRVWPTETLFPLRVEEAEASRAICSG